MRILGPSPASLAQSSWSLLSNALVGVGLHQQNECWCDFLHCIKKLFELHVLLLTFDPLRENLPEEMSLPPFPLPSCLALGSIQKELLL